MSNYKEKNVSIKVNAEIQPRVTPPCFREITDNELQPEVTADCINKVVDMFVVRFNKDAKRIKKLEKKNRELEKIISAWDINFKQMLRLANGSRKEV